MAGTYTYKSAKDGLLIHNIPSHIKPNSPELYALIDFMRSQGTTEGEMGAMAQVATPAPQPAPAGPDPGQQQAPETTLSGLGGAATRGAAPWMAAAGLGAALGAPAGGVGAVPGALIGLGAYGLTRLTGDLTATALNKLTGTNIPTASQVAEDTMTQLGVAQPRTSTERTIQAGLETAGSALSGAGVGQMLQRGAPALVSGQLPNLRQATGNLLAANPTQQAVGGLGAGLATSTAREMGAGPGGQLVAGLAGGLAGGVAAAPRTLKDAYRVGLPGEVAGARQVGIDVLTSDVLPPDTFAGKWLRSMGEKIPWTGTGPVRATQQGQRVQAVKDVLTEFGAGDAALASDAVMKDLLAKRGADLTKYTGLKTEVIDKLSTQVTPILDRVKWGRWDEIQWPEVGAHLKANPLAAEKLSPHVKNLMDDIRDGSVNGHSFAFVGDSAVDPYLTSLGVPQSVINQTDRELAQVFKNRGMLLDMGSGVGKSTPAQKLADAKMASQITDRVIKSTPPDIVGDPVQCHIAVEKAVNILKRPETAGAVPTPQMDKEVYTQVKKLWSMNNDAANKAAQVLLDWQTSMRGQKLDNVEAIRKQLGEAFTTPDLTASKALGEKAARAIYTPLKEDMGNFIKANGGPADYNKWMVANGRLAQMSGELQKDSLRRTLQQGTATPEVVQSMLFSAKPSDAAALYQGLTPQGRATAQVALLSKAAEKAGGYIDTNPQKFIAEVKRLGAPIGVFFKGADEQRLKGVLRAIELTKEAQVAGVTPATGIQATPFLAGGALTSILGGSPITGAAAVGSAGLLARAYESAPVRNILMKLPTVVKGSKEEGALFKRLLALGESNQNYIEGEK